MDFILDPLRKKQLALTPEERVRQWFIGVLTDVCGVPSHQMMSEVMLVGAGGKTYRADIIIYGKGGVPAAVVECKRPEVQLSPAVLEQALRYASLLNLRYLFLTNGSSTLACRMTAGKWEMIENLPNYNELLTF